MKLCKMAGQRGTGVLLVAAALMTGCASLSETDPYEKFNRQVFRFNDAVDREALRPVASAYQVHTPAPLQAGVSNFFDNLADVWTGANNLLQGKAHDGLSDAARVLINSTLGLGGLFDIASQAGLPKHDEDFGQTLGHWGVPAGPFLMLPLLGPSTLRDATALPVELASDPWSRAAPAALTLPGGMLRMVERRAGLLKASDLFDAAALDRYAFLRDAYLQRRRGKIEERPAGK